jgi:hypothetical protein
MTTLTEIEGKLLALKPGDSGVRITNIELMEIDVPGVSYFDTKSRAEWLRKRLPFACSLRESPTTADWVYSRVAN